MAALSHRKSASAGTSGDSCDAEDNGKMYTLYKYGYYNEDTTMKILKWRYYNEDTKINILKLRN